jgi:hypothetical protein
VPEDFFLILRELTLKIQWLLHVSILTAMFLIGPACFAQCEANGPDTSFGADNDTVGYHASWAADVPSWVRITRVVGPGTTSEDDGNGALLNAAVMTQKGVLAPDAYVKLNGFLLLGPSFFQYTNIDGVAATAQVLITFTLNGWKIGDPKHPYLLYATANGTTPTQVGFSSCVKVPAQYLRFAGKLKGGRPCNFPGTTNPLVLRTGETTCPALNEVEASIQIRIGTPGAGLLSAVFHPLPDLNSLILNSINVSGTASQITFRAMAPVVMVHGIRATSAWFSPYGFSPKGPTAYTNSWFNKPFDVAKAPYQAVDFDEDRITNGGARLATNLAGLTKIVSHPIPDAAATFGAKRIHIVAHSMGGLWSRSFMSDQLGSGAGKVPLIVLSLTTLDTPHLGSYNADLVAADTRAAANLANPAVTMTLVQRAMGLAAPRPVGAADLTTQGAWAFDLSNHLPNVLSIPGVGKGSTALVSYFSVSADANIDKSCVTSQTPCSSSNLPTISYTTPLFSPVVGDESEAYEYPDPDGRLVAWDAGQRLYRQMFQFKSATLRPCVNGGGFCLLNIDADGVQLNDFQVTLASARYQVNGAQAGGFKEIGSLLHNHTMVGQMDSAALILANILANVEALLP